MTKNRSVFMGTTLVTPGQGGIAVVARMTARALQAMGVEMEMVSLLDKQPNTIGEVKCPTTQGNRLAYLARCHLAAVKHPLFIYDSVGMARAHPKLPGLKRPYIVWMHGIEVWYHLTPEKERILRNADLVLVNSQFTLNRFQELHGPLSNAKVCHLATEEDDAPKVQPDFQGPPTVLILARQDKDDYYKGHKELIECWPHVVDAVPDARLVIAGGGDGVPVSRQLAANSPVAGQIEILGFVPDDELPNLWKRAHVFAMPSRGEGFGIVYAEAMRHGLPVVASVHDAGQEINRHGETGFNVDLQKKYELSSSLIRLLSDVPLATTMGQKGIKLWENHYRYDRFRHRFEGLLVDSF